jgi:hypothetical protein
VSFSEWNPQLRDADILGRNIMGGIFPLVDTALFNNLGFPGAASLLGAFVSDPPFGFPSNHTIHVTAWQAILC